MILTGSSRHRLMRWRGLLQSRIGLGVHRVPRTDSFDWELRRLIKLHQIDVVLDVGAHAGGFGRQLRAHVKYVGEIHSFEPGPVYEKLAASAAGDTLWRCHQYALGAKTEDRELLIMQDSDLSSFHEPLGVAARLFPGASIVERRQVNCTTVDSFVAGLGLRSAERLMLKIDTQGHDHEVLQGSMDSLGKIPIVLLEASVVQLYEHQQPMEATMALMREHGFILCGAYPVSRRHGVVLEFDCLFARAPGI